MLQPMTIEWSECNPFTLCRSLLLSVSLSLSEFLYRFLGVATYSIFLGLLYSYCILLQSFPCIRRIPLCSLSLTFTYPLTLSTLWCSFVSFFLLRSLSCRHSVCCCHLLLFVLSHLALSWSLCLFVHVHCDRAHTSLGNVIRKYRHTLSMFSACMHT